jgi:hypothetical protein
VSGWREGSRRRKPRNVVDLRDLLSELVGDGGNGLLRSELGIGGDLEGVECELYRYDVGCCADGCDMSSCS